MTEKRLEIYSKGEWTNARYDICEIECDGEVYCTVATKDVELIIDVLNENEQLKQEYQKLKHRHSLLHDECIDAECDRDRYHNDVLSLEKENEQLKKENQRLRKQKNVLISYMDNWCPKRFYDGIIKRMEEVE